MILKSFFRKKSTKIYITILMVLFISLFTLNAFISCLRRMSQEAYMETSFVFVESEEDSRDILKSDKYVENINTTYRVDYESGAINSNLIEYYELDYKSIFLPASTIDRVIAHDEIIVGISSTDYILNEREFPNYLESILTFLDDEERLELRVADIIDTGLQNRLYISDSLFDELVESSDTYAYLININDESRESKIIANLAENIDGDVLSLVSEPMSNTEMRIELETYLNYLSIANYVIMGIFIIVIIIVNKNLISDLEFNNKLEHRLGYNNFQIKINVIKRLLALHILVFIISTILSIPLLLFLGNLFELTIRLTNITTIYILVFIIVIFDIILGLLAKDKSIRRN